MPGPLAKAKKAADKQTKRDTVAVEMDKLRKQIPQLEKKCSDLEEVIATATSLLSKNMPIDKRYEMNQGRKRSRQNLDRQRSLLKRARARLADLEARA